MPAVFFWSVIGSLCRVEHISGFRKWQCGAGVGGRIHTLAHETSVGVPTLQTAPQNSPLKSGQDRPSLVKKWCSRQWSNISLKLATVSAILCILRDMPWFWPFLGKGHCIPPNGEAIPPCKLWLRLLVSLCLSFPCTKQVWVFSYLCRAA